MTVAGRTLRVLVGAVLAWWVCTAVAAPEVPRLAAWAAVAVAGASLWSPAAGLLLVAALTPAAALLAAAPVRAAELLAWAFLTAWLAGVWRPLARAPLPRAVILPATLYSAALASSWLMLTIGGAAGVSVSALPEFLAHSVPSDHLIFSSPEPETWTLLQAATGVALLVAAIATIGDNARLVRALSWVLVISTGALAAATLADVARQWSEVDYQGWFLLRYVRGERLSLHLADFNAAGSLYVLAAIVAAAVVAFGARGRGLAVAALVIIAPALWLTGSRTSFVAAAAGLLILGIIRQRRPLLRSQRAAVALALVLLALAGAVAVDWQSDVEGSASRSARLRAQFMLTSARMVASAPLFGVGIGRYFDRSSEFMPEELRVIYGNENAHNYFAQQSAELGIAGGLLFLWLAGSLVALGWSAVRTDKGQSPPWAPAGLFAGVSAYLLTCATGHPLLVPEAAFPFWIAAGALTGATGRVRGQWGTMPRALAAAACVVLAAGIARGALTYAQADVTPPGHGLHGEEAAPDGGTFRWMTRHAVVYVPNETGFVRLRLRAPDFSTPRPLVIETAVGGAIADRRELPPGRWITYDIPSRRSGTVPFRRVDLRANQWWSQEVTLGMRQARRPIAAMVGEIEWLSLGSR